MLTTSLLLQLAIAVVPVVGLVVLAVDQLSSKKSFTVRTVVKVMGLTLLPAVTILGIQGLLDSPVVSGFLGTVFGYVLANLVSRD